MLHINHSKEVYMANILPSNSVIGSLQLDIPLAENSPYTPPYYGLYHTYYCAWVVT